MSFLQDFEKYSQSEWRRMKVGLERMLLACKKFDHPERRLKSIHIAGTNGKGSVAAMLHSIFSCAGYRVGLFTSPHLVRINERFRVGHEEITDEELEGILDCIFQEAGPVLAVSPSSPHPASQDLRAGGGPPPAKPPAFSLTFFELCTLIAFLHFCQKKVDLAIFEVGLGGRLDATNVITPLVSVITEISYDHTQILGSDLKSIAREKAGIIKSAIPVICGATDLEVRRVIQKVAEEKKTPLYFVDFNPLEKFPYEIGLPGKHQIQNAKIVLKTLQVGAIHLPAGRHGELPLQVNEIDIQQGFAQVSWSGRLEWVSRDPPILFDGAHNLAGIRALIDYLRFPSPLVGDGVVSPSNQGVLQRGTGEGTGIKWKILFSAAKDKPVSEMLEELKKVTDEIKICRMNNRRSIEGEEASATYQKMIRKLRPGEGLLVTGSLYLVGEIKKGLLGLKKG